NVTGVDMSDIIDDAREIVKANGFEDKIVLLKGKMEEVTLPVDKVDLIVSEWMGYFLLYESMLDSVVFARDKYLAPGGACMPDKMTMLVAMLDDSEYLDFWKDVYGFDMTHMQRKVSGNMKLEPAIQHWEGKQLLSPPFVFKELKCEELAVKDLEFKAPFRVEASREGHCHGLITHFDTYFEHQCDKPVFFTTSAEEQTHWKQTTFYLEGGGVAVKKGDAIEGEFHVTRATHNPRHMDIVVQWAVRPAGGGRGKEVFQSFQLH
ncbi:protein arginine methyltransferase 3, isoform CRA_a, partial [Baffinella frigidus]